MSNGSDIKIIAVDEVQNLPGTLLVPVSPLQVPADRAVKVKIPPACPACGAKFSHSQEKHWCKICKLPDEIRVLGPRMIGRWKRKSGFAKRLHPASQTRKRNKPGRKGVKA